MKIIVTFCGNTTRYSHLISFSVGYQQRTMYNSKKVEHMLIPEQIECKQKKLLNH